MVAGMAGLFKMIKFSNNAETFLNSDLAADALIMAIGTGHGSKFAALSGSFDYELLTITDGVNLEIVKVTNWLGDVAQIVRGQEGTTPQIWGAGTLVVARLTSGILDSFSAESARRNFYLIAFEDGVTDFGVLYPNPADMPSLVIIEHITGYDYNEIYMPPIIGLSDVFSVDFIRQVGGISDTIIYPAVGEMFYNIVDEYVYMWDETHYNVVGSNGRWYGDEVA